VRELEIFAEEGMSPLEAIRAATGLAAEGVGREQELGTIEVGHLADIIAVEGEPHKNLRALRAVRWVMKGGQISFNQTVPTSQV
jgi:imidazolonepropionase-like amidohydrolase